jgi:FkbM family methyltransferase
MKRILRGLLNLFFPNKRFSIRETLLFGARMFVYSDQHTGRKILLSQFEREETKFFGEFIQEGFVCLDIGSNVGYFSVLFASKGAKVYAFDPVRENYALLSLTVALNPNLDIELRNCAIGDESGSIDFYIPEQTSLARIRSNSEAKGEDKRTVELITIDQLDLPRVDVVKIDVEGAEEKVIKGMLNTLARCKPKLLMVELVEDHLMEFSSNIGAVFDLLASKGMVPMVVNNGWLVPYEGGGVKNDNFFFVQKH